MGSGKTSVGLKLARRLERMFFDIDLEIEKSEGLSIKRIFKQKGESYFRGLETKVTKKISNFKNIVIATGGGSLLDKDSLNTLKNSGTIIWLKTDLEIIKQRLGNNVERPLLENSRSIEELYNARKETYEKADIIINTSDLTIEQIVEKICLFLI